MIHVHRFAFLMHSSDFVRTVVAVFISLPLGAAGCQRSQTVSATPALAEAARLPDVPIFESAILAPDVSVVRLTDRILLHVTNDTSPRTGHVPSNGLILLGDSTSTLFDTGWTDKQTEQILRFAANDMRRPVRTAIITHAHNDRLGGLTALKRAGIKVLAMDETVKLAERDGATGIETIAGLREGPVMGQDHELYFPGAGHAPDNIVAWFPGEKLVFGGCLIKPDTATTMGNVASADIAHWPRAIAAVEARYAAAEMVVPGHGAHGGASLLPATRRLVTEKGPAAAAKLKSP